MIQVLEAFLLEHWDIVSPVRRKPRRLRLALFASSREAIGHRIIAVFIDGRDEPLMMIKVPRHPRVWASLAREWRLLRVLHKGADEVFRSTIPRPLFMGHVEALPVFIQSAVGGVNLKSVLERAMREDPLGGLRAQAQVLEPWLCALHRLEPPRLIADDEPVPVRAPLLLRVSKALDRIRGLRSLPLPSLSRLEAALAPLQDLDADGADRVWVHGDLWPGNVLVEGRALRVIDWDRLEVGESWWDKYWYMLHLGAMAFVAGGQAATLIEGLRKVVCAHGAIGREVWSILAREDGTPAGAEILRMGDGARARILAMLLLESAVSLEGRAGMRVLTRAAPELLSSLMEKGIEPPAGGRPVMHRSVSA